MKFNILWSLSVFVLAGLLLSACAPAATPVPASTATAAPTELPPATATPAALASIKIVTYNILFGGGFDRSLDGNLPAKWRGIDRTPMIRDYLKQLNADIIGLQEASGWDLGDPPLIKTVADELGMNYVALPAWWGLDSALLTRYEIVESENLSDQSTNIIRAQLKGPGGAPINVFVVHLNSDSANDRSCSAQFLTRALQPYANQWTFLMGDMNFNVRSSTEWAPGALKEGGWTLLARDNSLGFDQVWAARSLLGEATVWSPRTDSNFGKMSDHSPSGLELTIYSPSGAVLPGTSAPTPMPVYGDLPETVGADLANPRMVYEDLQDQPCRQELWQFDGLNASLTEDSLRIYGKQGWASSAQWSKPISEDEGMLFDMKFVAGSEFGVLLDHGQWAAPEYRRFGMYLPPRASPFRPDLWRGQKALVTETDAWQGIAQAQPDTWYRLLLVAADGGRFRAYAWPVDDPSQVARYAVDMQPDWAGLPWLLSIGANSGDISLRSVKHLRFDAVKQDDPRIAVRCEDRAAAQPPCLLS